MSNDTTTVLNPGVGGDAMDETSVIQDDGVTVAKRARVDVGFQTDDTPGQLVSKDSPLPVEARELAVLELILKELTEIKLLLSAALET